MGLETSYPSVTDGLIPDESFLKITKAARQASAVAHALIAAVAVTTFPASRNLSESPATNHSQIGSLLWKHVSGETKHVTHKTNLVAW